MPFIEINFENIVFDPKIQTYCNNANFKCPNYSHSWACPPEAPYLEEKVSKFKKFFIIYYQVDLNKYVKKEKEKYPNRSVQRIKTSLYRKNLVRDYLEKEILKFLDEYDGDYEEKLVLWDGFCRVCYNKKDKCCTYDSGKPCRYPSAIRYSMEAVGIDVDKTVSNLDIKLEWPPVNYAYRFSLACFK